MGEVKPLLSILSYVAHGYVGNRAMVFPLQYHGWDVDTVNTTHYSNHPGYGMFKGQKSSPELVESIFQGLGNILDISSYYKVIVVGYCPSAAVMNTIYKDLEPIVQKASPKRPILVVDPVLGDNGRLYVPEELVLAHKDFLTKGLVDLTTPNQFELELLTGTHVSDFTSARKALLHFYDMYKVPNVVLTSVPIDGKMYCVGFSLASQTVFALEFEQINCSFSGCGDLFTALLTNAFYESGCVLNPIVLGSVLYKLHKVLQNSFEDEWQKTGQPPSMVKDIRIVSLRKVLDEAGGHSWPVKYILE